MATVADCIKLHTSTLEAAGVDIAELEARAGALQDMEGLTPVAAASTAVEQLMDQLEAERVQLLERADSVARERGLRLYQDDSLRTLMPRASDLPESFYDWFGRSKIVDAFGRPKLMYHGTDRAFDTFAKSQIKSGLYFVTADIDAAIRFGEDQLFGNNPDAGEVPGLEAQVMPMYVKSIKPFDSRNPAHFNQVLELVMSHHQGSSVEDVVEDLKHSGSNWALIEYADVIARIRELGFDSIQVTEDGALNTAVFDSAQLKDATGINTTFDSDNPNIYQQPSGQSGPRGFYEQQRSKYGNVANVITLTEREDLTTFLHETGHFWLHEMVQYRNDSRLTEEGKQQLEAELSTVKQWFADNASQAVQELEAQEKKARKEGDEYRADMIHRALVFADAQKGGAEAYMRSVAETFMESGNDTNAVLEIAFHELWARGFESYLGSGQAPSAGLRGAFRTFSRWIIEKYRTLSKLNVSLTPEVRDVMDRLLATDDAITIEKERRGHLLPQRVRDALPPEKLAEFDAAIKAAEEDARRRAAEYAAARKRRETTLAFKEARREAEAEAEAELDDEPLYRARAIILRGILPDGTYVTDPAGNPTGEARLSKEEVEQIFGKERLDALPDGTYQAGDAPMSVAVVAGHAGYDSAEDMLEALATPHLDENAEINRRASAAMVQKFGNPKTRHSEDVQEDAAAAWENDAELRAIVLMSKSIGELAGPLASEVATEEATNEGVQTTPTEDHAEVKAGRLDADGETTLEGAEPGLARAAVAEAEKRARRQQRAAQSAAAARLRQMIRDLDIPAIQAAAEAQIKSMQMKDILPRKLRRSAQQARLRADKALVKRDYTTAAAELQSQAMLHAMAAEAQKVKDTSERLRRRWQNLLRRNDTTRASLKPGGMDQGILSVIRAVMDKAGVRRLSASALSPQEVFDRIAEFDVHQAQDLMDRLQTLDQSIPEAPQGSKRAAWNYMTWEAFEKLANEVDTLQAEGRDMVSMIVHGRRVSHEHIINEMKRAITRVVSRPTGTGGMVDITQSPHWWNGINAEQTVAAMRRMDSWAREMDSGKNGPFSRYIIAPVYAALTEYNAARREPGEALERALEPVSELLQDDRTYDVTPLGIRMTFAQIFHFMLHTGNDSNLRKLLIGGQMDKRTNARVQFGAIDENGELNTEQYERAVEWLWNEGIMNDGVMDVVQNIWDINESLLGPAQQAHRSMYGRFFPIVRAGGFTSPTGKNYRGGYVPAVTDKLMNPDSGIHEDAQIVADVPNASMLPGAEDGFSKERAKLYAEPLLLDPRSLIYHVDTVLRFTYLGPTVRNVARLVTNKEFRSAMFPVSKEIVRTALIPWLQRTVRQNARQTGDWKAADELLTKLNQRIGLHYMMGNVSNALQQVTGLSSAMVVIPPHHLIQSLATWKNDKQWMRAYVESRSMYMQQRMNDSVRDVLMHVSEMMVARGKVESVEAYLRKHGYFLQQMMQNVIDPVVWQAAEMHAKAPGGVWQQAYDREFSATADEALARMVADIESAQYADGIVRQTQTPLNPEDISRLESGNALWLSIIKFWSYFNNMANLNLTELRIVARSNAGLLTKGSMTAYIGVFGVAIPSIMAEMIAMGLAGNLDVDDEDEEAYNEMLRKLLLYSQLKFVGGALPGGSTAVTALIGGFTPEYWDDKLTFNPSVNLADAVAKAVPSTLTAAGDLVTAERSLDEILDAWSAPNSIRTTYSVIAATTGLPSNWISKPHSYWAKVRAGTARPDDWTDYIQGALSGRDGTEN